MSQPLPELPLAFFAFVVGEDIRENAPGNVLDLVLRNTGIVDKILSASQVIILFYDSKWNLQGITVDERTIM